jgi:hypothetical protein
VVLIIGLLHACSSMADYTCGLDLGQRVLLKQEHAGGSPTLHIGMRGTVICFDLDDPVMPILVSWDSWTNGHSGTVWCNPPVLPFVPGSCWWMQCSQVGLMPGIPDLLDGGEQDRYFRPLTLEAGKSNQQFEVGFELRNGGPGDPLNVIYTRIYLSKDTYIAPSDYYLGEVDCYISGNGSMNMVWKKAFPTNIPAGIYYVGWIIDPDNLIEDEFDEANNTAFLTSYRLVVSGPAGQRSLEISAATGGQVTSPGEGVYTYPSVKSLPVAASPDPNCSFFAWTGTAVDVGKVANRFGASTTVTVDAKYTLTALFSGPHTVIDDFERFSDPANEISQVWVDGISFSPDKKGHTGNGTGAIVGNSEWPSDRNPTVHGGAQSMLFSYENGSRPWYSESERTWGPLQNWKMTGATELSIWFRGSSSNLAENLYVAVGDSAGKLGVSVYPDVLAVSRNAWTQWRIPLAEFEGQGVMTSRITKMCIGVGDRSNPMPGGHGTLYIDDITLGYGEMGASSTGGDTRPVSPVVR